MAGYIERGMSWAGGWRDGWVDGRMEDVWMNGRVDEWMDRYMS